ncbi:hypothetical protein [Gemmatimonas groenlandica]|uniref:Uncharacterized protein n=1 Tax=Gemmatimonas groenlandica TaxID=2732249 RepID=A0A6M4IV60_9BACT|nr:hypothetical protein [Gemmatimonas groenlandica]QJR37477.1 hypothetical protein HKW67_19145 [Gemmatimonas groenlandica]
MTDPSQEFRETTLSCWWCSTRVNAADQLLDRFSRERAARDQQSRELADHELQVRDFASQGQQRFILRSVCRVLGTQTCTQANDFILDIVNVKLLADVTQQEHSDPTHRSTP